MHSMVDQNFDLNKCRQCTFSRIMYSIILRAASIQHMAFRWRQDRADCQIDPEGQTRYDQSAKL
jgi:hypothetical protein